MSRCRAMALTGALFSLLALAHAAAQPASNGILGTWRIEHGVAAPWVKSGMPVPDAHTLVGRTVAFGATAVTGPNTLTCAHAHYEAAAQPAAGLFQGMLPSPPVAAAEPLGVTHFPVPGTRMNCDSGSYDFHRVDRTTLLIALDNVIWTLTKSPGALADSASPSGVVQAFLERHVAGDMGFDSASVAQKQAWMTTPLRKAIATYLARPSSPDDVPSIDGDPFTDSQEYPTRFAVGAATVRANVASVMVRFSDGYRDRLVTYQLRQERGAWRIADTRCEHHVTLSSLLK